MHDKDHRRRRQNRRSLPQHAQPLHVDLRPRDRIAPAHRPTPLGFSLLPKTAPGPPRLDKRADERAPAAPCLTPLRVVRFDDSELIASSSTVPQPDRNSRWRRSHGTTSIAGFPFHPLDGVAEPETQRKIAHSNNGMDATMSQSQMTSTIIHLLHGDVKPTLLKGEGGVGTGQFRFRATVVPPGWTLAQFRWRRSDRLSFCWVDTKLGGVR